jgi:hypothetical protein
MTSLWGISLGMLGWGLASLISRAEPAGESLPMFLMAASLGSIGALMVPSAYYALMRILERKAIDSRQIIRKLRPGTWIIFLPVVFGLGYLVSKVPEIAWLALPPLHVLAVGIPIAWMLYLAMRKLPSGSSQRMWGVYDSGMSLAPILIMIFEILAGLIFVVALAFYLSTRPQVAERLIALVRELQGMKSQEAAIQILAPFLVRPLVIGSVILFAAVIVPLVEEIFKPIGVWLLVGAKMSPQAGFVAGALSGAGYGFVESLALSGNSQDWISLVIARMGTSAVHILTASLTGWALVQAWQRRRFLRLALAYFCAVSIHGLWNGLTIAFSFKALAQMENLSLNLPIIDNLGVIAPIGLLMIAAGCFLGLIGANMYLRRSSRNSSGGEVEPVPEESRENML